MKPQNNSSVFPNITKTGITQQLLLKKKQNKPQVKSTIYIFKSIIAASKGYAES